MAEHTLPPKPVEKKEHSVRKSNKPLMEKRRRARINSCLGQLKTLVLQALKKDISQYSKLEKADILEMTVRHLRQLQREQISAAMATDPTVVTKYRAGFSECASEVMRYMSSVHGVSEEVRSRITNHLAGCIQVVNSVRKSEPITCTQPLHVQIPSALTPSSQAAGSLLMPVGLSSHTIVPCRKSAPVPSPPSKISSQISGSFQIIPGNFSGSAVAVYLGPTNGCSPLQSSDTTARPTAALPLYSIQVPNTAGNPPAYIPSPTTTSEQSKSEPERADLRNVISPVCSPNSFKDEPLWRPW